MEVPVNLLKSCLAHILADWVGRIQPIMSLVVLYCMGTIHPHVQYNP